jgi:CheY-like chemotaxis protein
MISSRRGVREWGLAVPLPGQSSSRVVLVADDDADVRAMLRTLLELDGFAVVEAEDGTVAWRLIQEHEPPVAVVDIHMPGLDGLDICRLVRKTRLACKVIVYTAGMATEEEARNAGCDQYVLKTEPLPQLRDAVRRYSRSGPPG